MNATIKLVRTGDFYEAFGDDARILARAVGLAVTSRTKGENAVPMAGFLYHSLTAYVDKLRADGYQVEAIAPRQFRNELVGVKGGAQ